MIVYSIARTVTDRAGKTVHQLTYTPGSAVAALATTVNGLLVSSRSASGLVTTYAYDALGRQVAVQDARGAVHSRGYDEHGRVAWESDPATNGTWYAYDALGRRTAVTNALGQVTHTAYDAEGRTIATWGATYPVAYEYDASGRMTAMLTSRDSSLEISGYSSFILHPSSFDRTTWSYDQPTGLLTNKLYADGKGTAYTYTPDGKLATRAWARGVTTTYAYDAAGSLATIAYSDSTPGVTFTYDRLGRMASATVAGVSTNLFTYDALDLVAETQNGVLITRTTDSLGRPVGFSLGPDYAVQYAYDAYGRFHSVSSSVQSAQSVATYSYLPGSDLISGMTASSGILWTRAYESARSLITSVENRHGETVISRYDYTNDELGRRTRRADSGLAFAVQPAYGDPATIGMPAYNAYSYNARSEVTGATRRWGTPDAPGALVLGQQYAYEFDSIGNRIAAAEGDTSRIATYTANALNQYTQRTVPAEKDLIGTAPTNVAVTINAEPAARQFAYWHHALEVDNATDAAYPRVAITAVYNPPGTNAPDIVTSQTGRVFVAQTPEAFTYDDDGNLTQDGRFTYTWDAENRLIGVTTCGDLPASVPRIRVEYTYDHQSRRIASATAVRTNATWQATESRAFLYDGWNVVQETINHQPSTTNYYTWGLDLSGSLQGAGGIGGLLAASLDGTTAFYCYDANGNVGQLVSPDGELLAHYEYSPFGETIVSTGPLAKANPFRFSTKHWDDLTGLGYWGYRYYHPEMGGWLSRDPIHELGTLQVASSFGVREEPTALALFASDLVDEFSPAFVNLFLSLPDSFSSAAFFEQYTSLSADTQIAFRMFRQRFWQLGMERSAESLRLLRRSVVIEREKRLRPNLDSRSKGALYAFVNNSPISHFDALGLYVGGACPKCGQPIMCPGAGCPMCGCGPDLDYCMQCPGPCGPGGGGGCAMGGESSVDLLFVFLLPFAFRLLHRKNGYLRV